MPKYYGGELRVRKTVAFTGAAGLGAQGTVNVFTITGRVLVTEVTAFCTEDLASAGGGTVALGTANSTTKLITTTTATGIDINEWWTTGTGVAEAANIIDSQSTVGAAKENRVLLASSVIITVGTADVTDGTLIIDIFYKPVTDDGVLVAA